MENELVSGPDGVRTRDRWIKSPSLYLTKLQAQPLLQHFVFNLIQSKTKFLVGIYSMEIVVPPSPLSALRASPGWQSTDLAPFLDFANSTRDATFGPIEPAGNSP